MSDGGKFPMPMKPGEGTKKVTILTYSSSVKDTHLKELEVQIKKKCKCKVKQNVQENTFILENSKAPSSVFMHIQEITKWSEKIIFVNQSGHETTSSFETSDAEGIKKVTILVYSSSVKDISTLKETIEKKCQCKVKQNGQESTFILVNSKAPSAGFLKMEEIIKWSEKSYPAAGAGEGDGSKPSPTGSEEGSKPTKPGHDEEYPGMPGEGTKLGSKVFRETP